MTGLWIVFGQYKIENNEAVKFKNLTRQEFEKKILKYINNSGRHAQVDCVWEYYP